VFSSSIEDFENKILLKAIPSLFKQGEQDLKTLRKKLQDPSSSSNTNTRTNDKQSKQSKTMDTSSKSRVSRILDKQSLTMDSSSSTSRVSQFFDKKCQSAADNISQCINNAMGNNHSELDYTSYQSFPSSQEDHGDHGDSITSYNMNNKNDDSLSSTPTITQKRKFPKYSPYDNKSFTETNGTRTIEDPLLDININPNVPRDYSQIIDFGSELNFLDEQSTTTKDNQSYNFSHGKKNAKTFSNDNFSNSIKSLINEIDRLKTNFNNYHSIGNNSSRNMGKNSRKSGSTSKKSGSDPLQDVLYLDSLYDDIVTRTNTIANQSQSYTSEYLHQYHMQENPRNTYSTDSNTNELSFNPPPPLYFNKDSDSTDSEIRRIYNELNSNSISSRNNHTKMNTNNSNHNDYSNNSVQEMTTEDHEFQNKLKLIRQKKEREQMNMKRNYPENVTTRKSEKSDVSKTFSKNTQNNNKSNLTNKNSQDNQDSRILKFNSKVQMNEIDQHQSSDQIYQYNINQTINSSNITNQYTTQQQQHQQQQQRNIMMKDNKDLSDSNSLLIKYDDSVTNDTEEEDQRSQPEEEEEDDISDSYINTNTLLNTHINTETTSIHDIEKVEEDEENEIEENEKEYSYYSFDNSSLKNEKVEGKNK